MSNQRLANNFRTSLASTFGASDTTLNLASAAGLPTLAAGEFMLLTLFRLSGVEESGHETVKVTSRVGTACTVQRSYEGAAASQFLVAGTVIASRWTAKGAEAKANKDDLGSASAKNAPEAGVNATSTQVVMGDDTRLSNARDIALAGSSVGQVPMWNGTAWAVGAIPNALQGGNFSGAINLKKGDEIVSAATINPWTTSGNYLELTGNEIITGIENAPQAGASRRLLVKGNPTFSGTSNMVVLRGNKVKLAPGDYVEIFAETTIKFNVTVFRDDGFLTGDIRITARTLPSSEYLLANGTVYPQTSNPELSNFIGPFFEARKTTAISSIISAGVAIKDISISSDSSWVMAVKAETVLFSQKVGGVYGSPQSLPTSGVQYINCAIDSDGVYGYAVEYSSSTAFRLFKRTGTTWAQVTAISNIGPVRSNFALNPQDNSTFVISVTGTLYFYKRNNDTVNFLGNTTIRSASVTALKFSLDGTYLAIGYNNGILDILKYNGIVWVLASTVNSADTPNGVQGLAFTPEGYLIASGGSANTLSLALYERSAGTDNFLIQPNAYPPVAMRGIAISPDGGTFFGGGITAGNYLLQFRREGKSITQIANPTDQPEAIAYSMQISGDGTTLVMTGNTTSAPMALYVRSYNHLVDFKVPNLIVPLGLKAYIKA